MNAAILPHFLTHNKDWSILYIKKVITNKNRTFLIKKTKVVKKLPTKLLSGDFRASIFKIFWESMPSRPP